MASQVVISEGDSKLHKLRELIGNSFAEPARRPIYKCTIVNPSLQLGGATNTVSCAVGFDDELVTQLAPAQAITFKTSDPAKIVWQDGGTAAYLNIFWYVDVVETRPEV